jgi:small-conductance mechanosensitive channel
MKPMDRRFGYACLGLVFLCGLILWFRQDSLPENIPMFQTFAGSIVKTSPRSFWTVARLPLMHLVLLSVILTWAKACPNGSDWSGMLTMGILTATCKAVFEILGLAFGNAAFGIGAGAVVFIFLVTLVYFLRKRNWSFKFQTLPLSRVRRVIIGFGLLVYILLVTIPFWLNR